MKNPTSARSGIELEFRVLTEEKKHNLQVENYALFGTLLRTIGWVQPLRALRGWSKEAREEPRYASFLLGEKKIPYSQMSKITITQKINYFKLMISVPFYIWEDARIWAYWNDSLDVCLHYLGLVSSFSRQLMYKMRGFLPQISATLSSSQLPADCFFLFRKMRFSQFYFPVDYAVVSDWANPQEVLQKTREMIKWHKFLPSSFQNIFSCIFLSISHCTTKILMKWITFFCSGLQWIQ